MATADPAIRSAFGLSNEELAAGTPLLPPFWLSKIRISKRLAWRDHGLHFLLEPAMDFRMSALAIDPFREWFALSDDALKARGARRVVADGRPAYPCRVSLQDAAAGEALVLVPYLHHDVDTPYRASGPIYVREAALQAQPERNEVPTLLRARLLSLRAYDAQGLMQGAEVVAGEQVEATLDALFALPRVHYLHVHYARPGCYACRVDRAD